MASLEQILKDLRAGFVKAGLDEEDLDKKMKLQQALQPQLQGALSAAGLQHLGSEAATWTTMQVGLKSLEDVAKKGQRLADYLDLEGDDATRLQAALEGKPVAKPAAKPAVKAAAKIVVEGRVGPPRKLPASSATASPDLLWQCMRKTSAFVRNPGPGAAKPRQVFTAEPANLMGIHSCQFSGLASDQALDVRSVRIGQKERVELVQSSPMGVSQRCPGKLLLTTGLKKCSKKGLQTLDIEVAARAYRPGLHGIARLKYMKILQSFKKKKRLVSSRRAK
eukprot:TRINITY_DN76279_c0_g1_i1.p1 TRINITY_DN76279_c0_g1~~TRINITY_DN76279_c0_g1_i1.p1  ORF type:complete len:297 (+),score=74.52 TRINITY_DN76279_c0_g1_i1:55-891(+)